MNPLANYGPSNFDRSHIFTFTHNWQLPFGTGPGHFNTGVLSHILGPWELDGILRSATGLPFTPTASAAPGQCTGTRRRPMLYRALPFPELTIFRGTTDSFTTPCPTNC